MTLDEIKDRIEEIKEKSYDDEYAHVLEDRLYLDFIKYIATEPHGSIAQDADFGTLTEKAEEILKTGGIGFARWYA